MEKKMMRYAGFFFTLTFISLLLIGGLLLFDVVFVAHTPSYITQAAASSDIDIRVQSLETGLESLERDLVFQLNQKLYYFGGTALLISALAAFFGWRTFKDLDKLIQQKVSSAIDKSLYQLDPINLKIWVQSDDQTMTFTDRKGKKIELNIKEKMDKVEERIELTGLSKPKCLQFLDKNCYRGVTIAPVFNLDMEKDFRDYLKKNKKKLDPKQAAFILYTNGYQVSPTETLDKYANLGVSNIPVAVASMILTVGRGLSNSTPKDEKEDK